LSQAGAKKHNSDEPQNDSIIRVKKRIERVSSLCAGVVRLKGFVLYNAFQTMTMHYGIGDKSEKERN